MRSLDVMRVRCLVGLVALAGMVGCSSSVDPTPHVASANDSNVKRLSNLYRAYQMRHSWKGPKDEAALKEFIKTQMAPDKLQMMGVDPNQVDALFISERDGKPFKIRFGAVGGALGPLNAVVFEEVGVDGKRQVGITGGVVEETDDARYEELWAGKGLAPGAEAPASG